METPADFLFAINECINAFDTIHQVLRIVEIIGNSIDCRNSFDYFGIMRSGKSRQATATAVSIDPALYEKALKKRILSQDTNFSRYVRELIREDLRRSGLLPRRAK